MSTKSKLAALEDVKSKIKRTGKSFVFDHEDEQTDEYAHFLFVGQHDGREVVFDAVLCTLRLHYESELYGLAEEKVLKQFPMFEKYLSQKHDDGGNAEPTKQEEEIGLLMAEVMSELEEDEAVKVKEYVDIDENFDDAIGIDASLNVPEITPAVIEDFIAKHHTGSLTLDPILYSFHAEDDDQD